MNFVLQWNLFESFKQYALPKPFKYGSVGESFSTWCSKTKGILYPFDQILLCIDQCNCLHSIQDIILHLLYSNNLNLNMRYASRANQYSTRTVHGSYKNINTHNIDLSSEVMLSEYSSSPLFYTDLCSVIVSVDCAETIRKFRPSSWADIFGVILS